MSTPSLEEAKEDIQISNSEITHLTQIIDGITGFIHADPRENRLIYQHDIYKYEHLLQECKRIKAKIEKYIQDLQSKPNEQ